MAAGPLSVSSNASTNNDGILIGDKVYAEVFLTIDNSLIPDERLSPTPSMLDGLDLSTETDLRILGCELIQSAGIVLRLPQVCSRGSEPLWSEIRHALSIASASVSIGAEPEGSKWRPCVVLASFRQPEPHSYALFPPTGRNGNGAGVVPSFFLLKVLRQAQF